MAAPAGDVTPQVLLDHMRAMEERILTHVDERFTKVDERFTTVDERLERLEGKVDLISIQISNIDQRLDTLEVEKLPKVKKAVGIR